MQDQHKMPSWRHQHCACWCRWREIDREADGVDGHGQAENGNIGAACEDVWWACLRCKDSSHTSLLFFVMRYAAAHCFNNYIANKLVLLVGLGQQFAMQVNSCSAIVTTTHLYFQNVLFKRRESTGKYCALTSTSHLILAWRDKISHKFLRNGDITNLLMS